MNYTPEKIKQIFPLQGDFSTMLGYEASDGEMAWADAEEEGWQVFLALVDGDGFDDEVVTYSVDHSGVGGIERRVRFVPARYCEKCGKKMWARIAYQDADPTYICRCEKENRAVAG